MWVNLRSQLKLSMILGDNITNVSECLMTLSCEFFEVSHICHRWTLNYNDSALRSITRR